MTGRSVGIRRRGAGQGNDLDNLFGGKGVWCARSRRIGQHRRNGGTQRERISGWGARIDCGGTGPAQPPGAHGIVGTAEGAGDLGNARPIGSRLDDARPADKGLWGAVLTDQLFQYRALRRRDRDRGWLRTGHNRLLLLHR